MVVVVVVMNPGESFVNVMCDMEDGVITNANCGMRPVGLRSGRRRLGWEWQRSRDPPGVGYQRCEV